MPVVRASVTASITLAWNSSIWSTVRRSYCSKSSTGAAFSAVSGTGQPGTVTGPVSSRSAATP